MGHEWLQKWRDRESLFLSPSTLLNTFDYDEIFVLHVSSKGNEATEISRVNSALVSEQLHIHSVPLGVKQCSIVLLE